MRTALLLFALCLPSFAADKARLLVSVHLVPQEQKLSWTVAIGEWRGTGKDRTFWPERLEEYTIDLDKGEIDNGSGEPKDIPRATVNKLRDMSEGLTDAARDFTQSWKEAEADKPEPPKAPTKSSKAL